MDRLFVVHTVRGGPDKNQGAFKNQHCQTCEVLHCNINQKVKNNIRLMQKSISASLHLKCLNNLRFLQECHTVTSCCHLEPPALHVSCSAGLRLLVSTQLLKLKSHDSKSKKHFKITAFNKSLNSS